MYKIAWVLILNIILTNSVFSQKMTSWSDEINIGGYERLVHSSPEGIYVQRSPQYYFEDRRYESDIAKYSSNGKLLQVVEVANLENRDYQELASVATNAGIAVIYITTDTREKKNWLIAAQLYDYNTLEPVGIVDIGKIKYRRGKSPKMRDYRGSNSLIDIDVITNEDKSTVAIVYSEERIAKDEYTHIEYIACSAMEGLAVINSGSIETEDRSDKYILQDMAVNTNGDLTVLMKEYTDSRSLEFFNRLPGYRYSVYFNGADDVDYIYDIPTEKYYIDEMLTTLDNEGNTYLSGMIRKKPYNNVWGTRAVKINKEGEKLFDNENLYSKKEIKKIRNKEKQNINEGFEIIDIKVADEILYTIHQNVEERTRIDNNNDFFYGSLYNRRRFGNNLNNNYVYYLNKDNYLIHGIDLETGDRLWSTVDARSQSEYDGYEYFTYDNILVNDSDLIILSNDKLNNLIKEKEGKNPSNVDIPRNKVVTTLTKVTPLGKKDRSFISEEGKYYSHNEGAHIRDGVLTVLQVRNNFKKFKVGQLKM